MNSLSCAFEKIRELSYIDLGVKRNRKTQETGDAHEDKICEILREFDIHALSATELSDEQISMVKNGRLQRLEGKLPPGNWYIHQPCSSQGKPDILIQYNGKLFPVECKTGGERVTFNDALPVEGFIYIFTEESSNSTTYFLGDEVDVDVREELRKLHESVKAFVKPHNERIKKLVGNILGFTYYPRQKYQQVGGRDITSFTQRPDRESLERRVIDKVEIVSGDRDPSIKTYFRTYEYFKGDIVELPDGRKGVVAKVRGDKIDIILEGSKQSTTLKHKQPVNPEIRHLIAFPNIPQGE